MNGSPAAWLRTLRVLLAVTAIGWLGCNPAPAQTPAAAAGAEPSPEAGAAPQKLSDEEVDALVTRIALYPDPLLAAVLQASTLPLQVVEADRFLERRKKDPAAQVKPEWDSSIVALLNYGSVVDMMSDDLDWTQRLGDAVLNQLGDVQDSIQQFRGEVQAAGLLKSDDKQVVTAEGDTIRIMPAQADVIYVPMYDGPALAAAIAAAPPAPAAEPAPAPESAAPPSGGGTAPAPQALPPPTTSYEPAPAAAAPAPTTVAAGSTVVYPPAYPPAYPPPVYSQPYPSFWTPGASFVGGALVGGVLGYAIGEDNDDIEIHGDCCNGGGRNVSNSGNRTVSGNTVNVVRPNRTTNNTQTQAALRQRSGQNTASATRAQTAQTTRAQIGQGGVTPASARTAAPQRTTADPARARPQQASAAAPRSAQQAGAASRSTSAMGNTSSGRDAWKESSRGAQSRSAASAAPQRQPASAAQPRPSREASSGAMQQQRSSSGAFANQSSGARAAQQSSRGASSRASAGGGGRGGGSGGGGRGGGGRGR